MSQHLWLILTDNSSGEVFYVPYEAICELKNAVMKSDGTTSVVLVNNKIIELRGTPKTVFGAMAAAFAAADETFVTCTYPVPG